MMPSQQFLTPIPPKSSTEKTGDLENAATITKNIASVPSADSKTAQKVFTEKGSLQGLVQLILFFFFT